MYLEDRVTELEQVTADQGRQSEAIAKGLADLTVDVRAIRSDMTAGFKQVNGKIDQLSGRFDQLSGEFGQLSGQFEQMNNRFDEMQQTQQLILKLLTEKL